MFETELTSAISIAKEAGRLILSYYETGFSVEEKDVFGRFTEPVTEADRAASELIVSHLARAFPDDAILSEEAEDDLSRFKKKRTWMIDPIDGTIGFIEGAGDFAVQIGLVEDGKPVMGVVYQPSRNRLYYASSGGGAFLSDDDDSPQSLKVSEAFEINRMTLAVSRSHRSKRMTRLVEHFGFAGEVSHGSVGLKVGLLAKRDADAYIHLSPKTKYWDTAAPQIILEEAGGRMTDLFGEDLSYNLKDTQNHNGIIATNGIAHENIVLTLRPLLTEFQRVRVTKSR